MERDMELVRKILDFAEANADDIGGVEVTIEGHEIEQVNYHVDICAEAGLLFQFGQWTTGDPRPRSISRLSWLGHDRLDEFRRPPRIVPV